jgi:hypothetical protein
MGCLKVLFLIILSPIWLPIWLLSKIPVSVYKFLGLILFTLIFWPFMLLFWLFRKAYRESNPTYAYIGIGLIVAVLIWGGIGALNRQNTNASATSAAQTQAFIRFETQSVLNTEAANATATATLWTPTNTLTPSTTPTPSITPIASNTRRPTNSAIPTATLQLIQTDGGLIFVPVAIGANRRIDSLRPDNDIFVVIAGELVNRTNSLECLYGRDMALVLDGREYHPNDEVMAAVQDDITPRRDYLGNGLGHCVNRNDQEGTYVAFDVPNNADTISLSINEELYPLAIDWSSFASHSRGDFFQVVDLAVTVTETALGSSTERAIRQETSAAQETQSANATATATLWTATNTSTSSPTFTPSSTATASNTPTITPTASITFTPSITPTAVPSNTRRPTALPDGTTYYANRDARVRSCAEANDSSCPTIGNLVRGDDIEVLASVNGSNFGGSTQWYQVNYRGQLGYVHSSLLQRTQPVIATAAPVTNNNSGGSSNGNTIQATNPPVSQPQWSCTGDIYNCDSFATCSEMSSYFNSCPGDPSNLDGNNDGRACESRCG